MTINYTLRLRRILRSRTNRKWDRESVLEEAKKYSSRIEFKKHSSYAYKMASRLGIIDIALIHIPRFLHTKKYWNKDNILKESSKHIHRVDFFNKSKNAYRAAQKLKILNEVCAHMIPKKSPIIYWTEDKIREIASKYDKKITFQKENSGAYAAARKLGIANEICSHMEFKNDQLDKSDIGRVCKGCNKFKLREFIGKSSRSRSGMATKCRDCKSIESKNRLINYPEKFTFHTSNRRAMHKNATPIWITKEDKKVMLSMYKEAREKTKELNVIHEVDHIIPIRSKLVCGLHVPYNLQVITRDQNRSKSNRIVDNV